MSDEGNKRFMICTMAKECTNQCPGKNPHEAGECCRPRQCWIVETSKYIYADCVPCEGEETK